MKEVRVSTLNTVGWGSALVIFCIIAAFRIYLSLMVPSFTDDTSYWYLRVDQNHDELSYGGRILTYNPLTIWFFRGLQTTVLSDDNLKIAVQILNAAIVLIVYWFASKFSANLLLRAGSAAASGVIPIHYALTIGSVSILSVLLPILTFALGLTLLRLMQKQPLGIPLQVLWIFLSLIHPASLVFILGLIIYWWLLFLYKMPISSSIKELIFATTTFGLGYNFFIYYPGILVHKFDIFSLSSLFSQYVTFEAIVPLLPQLGIFLLAMVAYTLYIQLREAQPQPHFILAASIALSIVLSMLCGFLSADIGFLFLVVPTVFLLPFYGQDFVLKLHQTKFDKYLNPFLGAQYFLLVLSLLIAIIPYVIDTVESAPTPEYLQALAYVKLATPADSLIIVPAIYAQEAMYYTQRKTLVDTYALLAQQPQERELAVEKIYQSRYRSVLGETAQEYNFNRHTYVLSDKRIENIYGVPPLQEECYAPIFVRGDARVYRLECGLAMPNQLENPSILPNPSVSMNVRGLA